MEKPQDFPKSLAVLTGISAFLFVCPPAIGFHYLGQYSTAPAFGSLGPERFKKGSFAFVIVPTTVIAVIYSNVTAKFIYYRVMGKSRHAHSNTIIGWGVWFAVIVVIWVLALIFAEVIPSMGDFLSLLGAAFDSFFGFMSIMTVIHICVMLVGLFLLGPGLYAAVKAIIADYSGATNPAFSCADLSI
ncbi:hypothetical protein CLCR_06289 [Cladophialophora carrionii]|uniref:Amino acid transporter transmembrane domain-containing protein n=1 Tax=Cladophialophora carrionii TaxID=86049 RepID=A0A1C1C9Z2_9EURO|nr:hypothetical protein CLCR_06289 [Cladophialophora carrionii]